MHRTTGTLLFTVLAFLPATTMAEMEVVVSPRVTVVEREGITGGGCPVVFGDRVLSFYTTSRPARGSSEKPRGTVTACGPNRRRGATRGYGSPGNSVA